MQIFRCCHDEKDGCMTFVECVQQFRQEKGRKEEDAFSARTRNFLSQSGAQKCFSVREIFGLIVAGFARACRTNVSFNYWIDFTLTKLFSPSFCSHT